MDLLVFIKVLKYLEKNFEGQAVMIAMIKDDFSTCIVLFSGSTLHWDAPLTTHSEDNVLSIIVLPPNGNQIT